MAPQTAELIFFAVVPVFLVVWLAGTWFALSRTRPPAAEEPWTDLEGESGGREAIAGEVKVRGDAETLSRKIAEHLAAGTLFRDGSNTRITERTPERVAFERSSGGRKRFPGRSGRMILRREGDRTRIRYELDAGNRAIFRLIAILVCFVYGGLFVFGVPLAIWLLVVHSENPTVRWQTFQVFQMVHGVWPPFLIGGIWSRIRKQTSARIESFLANLEYVA